MISRCGIRSSEVEVETAVEIDKVTSLNMFKYLIICAH